MSTRAAALSLHINPRTAQSWVKKTNKAHKMCLQEEQVVEDLHDVLLSSLKSMKNF